MAALAKLLTCAALASATTLVKRTLPDDVAAQRAAYALDGSPYAYFSPDDLSATDWVLYFEGGGECETHIDCVERSATSLGSSRALPATLESDAITDGVLSSRAEANNPFAAFGFVYLPYLSGDDWLGAQSAAADPWGSGGARPLWFAGANNARAAVADWLAALPAPPARVLVSGGSAGGQGAFFHADAIAEMLPAGAVVKANPQYGWFEPPNDRYPDWLAGSATDPTIPYPSSKSPFPVPAWMLGDGGVKLSLPRACVDAAQESSPWACTSTPRVAPSVRVPLFISTNVFDAWTTDVMEQCPTSDKLASGDPRLEYLLTVTAPAMRDSARNATAGGNERGVFAPACLSHPMAWADSEELGGCTHAQAVASWFFGTDECERILIDYRATAEELAAMSCNAGRFEVA